MDVRFSFKPKDYLIELWHMMAILIISLIVGAVGGLAYSKTMVNHLYESTTKFYVMSGDWETQGRSDDYVQIITSQPVIRTVIAQENLKDANGKSLSYEDFLGMVEVSAYDETHIAGITIYDSDPYRACDIANTLREVSMDAIEDIMNPGAIKVVQKAIIPGMISKPNEMLFCVMGAASLFVIALIMTFLKMIAEKNKEAGKRRIRRMPYILFLSLLGIVFVIRLFLYEIHADRTGPEIQFPEADVTYEEGDDYTDLLQGVKALDSVDGDCTDAIRINDVNILGSGETCIVNYAVKDKSNNVTFAERYASYRKMENDAEDSIETSED